MSYRKLLQRKYYALINELSLLSNIHQKKIIITLKAKLGYQSVTQLTDLALCEVLAKINQSIEKYK